MALYSLGASTPNIDADAYVHPDAVLIGAVTLGAGSSVWPGAVIRADDAPIVIGARTSIQDGSVVHTTVPFPTMIGDDVVVGHMVHLEGCTIEDLTLIGSGSVVLHEAVVHTGSIVGANAVVTNRMVVPSGSMALGVPAKVRPADVSVELIRLNADNYVQRARRYRAELRRVD